MQGTEIPRSPWQHFPSTYRAAEMRTLTNWIRAGASGAVLGLRGVGRSNLLGFLCHRPDVLHTYIDPNRLAVVLVPVDLGDLPTPNVADLYRVILRAFAEVRSRFAEDTQKLIAQLYHAHSAQNDPFLLQNALRGLLRHLQGAGWRVVLVMDRFDNLCRMLTADMAQALGTLHDTFRDTLLYIVGIRQSLVYLEELEISDDLYRLLTTHICYLGPLTVGDARYSIARRTGASEIPPSAEEIDAILTLTGGYPTLLKALCRWWLLEPDPPPPAQWLPLLAAMPTIQHRLHGIWSGLTQEEQLALTELVKGNLSSQGTASPLQQRYAEVLLLLATKGLCRRQEDRWSLFGGLFTDYVAHMGGMSRGRIWLDAATETLYHGPHLLDNLTHKEATVLQFLVKHPGVRHSYTDVITNVWSDEESYHGVTNDSLFQVIKGLRRKIEPDAANPVYVVNWRAKPEGGYIFYPEGRPT